MTKEEMRQTILQTAMELFRGFGPSKTTVADIARRLDMSPANIYNFFPSRDAIIEAVGGVQLCGLQNRICSEAALEMEGWAQLRTLFLSTARTLRDHLQNEKDILHLQLLATKYQWEFVNNFHRFLRDSAEATIRRAVANGAFRPMEPRSATRALFDCMMLALDPLLMVRLDPTELEQRIEAQLALLEHAFRAPPLCRPH